MARARVLGVLLYFLCAASQVAVAQECPGGALYPPLLEKAQAEGVIADAGDGTPLPNVVVVIDSYPLGMTDCRGHYEVVFRPFGPHRIVINHKGYVSVSQPVTVVEGKTQTINIALVSAAAPCCRLAGAWKVTLHLDSAGAIGPRPTARDVAGTLSFADSIPFPIGRAANNVRVRQEAGSYAVDFAPFFGGEIGRDVSSTTFGPTNDGFETEVIGTVFAGDSVYVDLIPRLSHGGVSMWGRLVGDSLTGRWYQRAYCCGATGSFVMLRMDREE